MAMTNERKLLLLGLLRRTEMHGYMLNAHLGGTVPITLKKPTAYNLLDRSWRTMVGWNTETNPPETDRAGCSRSRRRGNARFWSCCDSQLAEFTPAELLGLVSISFLDALPATEVIALLRLRRVALAKH